MYQLEQAQRITVARLRATQTSLSGGFVGVGASVEDELGGVGEGDIYDAGGGGEGAGTRVESGTEDVGCVCCKGWEEEGGFLG